MLTMTGLVTAILDCFRFGYVGRRPTYGVGSILHPIRPKVLTAEVIDWVRAGQRVTAHQVCQ